MVHLALLIDESGSMGPLRQDVVGGVNEYVDKLKNELDDALVSFYTFDLGASDPIVRAKFEALALKDVREVTADDYQPRGSTPLNDAVIRTIRRMSEKVTVTDKDKVMLTIYTDGLENASESSSKDVHRLISEKEKAGWEFVYLGANQDAWAVAQQYGMAKAGQTYSTMHTGQGMSAALRTAGNVSASYAKTGSTVATASMPTEIGEDEIEVPEDKA